jgi:hypothetical protein
MKKTLLLLLTVFCCSAGFAQKRVTTTSQTDHNLEGSSGPENNGFGVKGGLIVSSLQGPHAGAFTGLKKQQSYHAGFYAQFSVTNNFSIQPEALYARKGFAAAGTDTHLDYFDVPVLASFRVLDNISLLAGPQVSVLMTVKENDKELDKAFHNSFDYGAAAGIEGRLSVFRLGARYTHSFENIYKGGYTMGGKPATDVQHSNLQFYIGAGF